MRFDKSRAGYDAQGYCPTFGGKLKLCATKEKEVVVIQGFLSIAAMGHL